MNNNPGIHDTVAPVLYRNDVGDRQNWVEVELVGTTANRDAVGSEVRVQLSNGITMLRHVMIGSGYASQSSLRLHFGIGEADAITKLTVNWKGPGAGEDVFEDPPVNRILKIVQGESNQTGKLSLVTPRQEAAGIE